MHYWHIRHPFALPQVLLHTPLVYGTKTILPIEVEIPSLRILTEAQVPESEWAQTRHDQLHLINEKKTTGNQ